MSMNDTDRDAEQEEKEAVFPPMSTCKQREIDAVSIALKDFEAKMVQEQKWQAKLLPFRRTADLYDIRWDDSMENMVHAMLTDARVAVAKAERKEAAAEGDGASEGGHVSSGSL